MLQYPEFLSAKGLSAAQISSYYLLNGNKVFLTSSAAQNLITFGRAYTIKLALPKVCLINAIWWSNFYYQVIQSPKRLNHLLYVKIIC